MTDWNKIRNYFPAVGKVTYLDTAAGGPISTLAHREAALFYDQILNRGDIHWKDWLLKVEVVRGKIADLINADREGVAFLQNTSHGMNLIAQMLKGSGGVLAMDDDFPTATVPFLKQGFHIDFVRSNDNCVIHLEDIEARITDTTKILVTSTVQYSTGFRQDLAKLAGLCKEKGLIFVVDASQSICSFPVDVKTEQIDFLVFSGNKWGISGYGIGVLYIEKDFINASNFPIASWMSVKNPSAMDNRSMDFKETAAMLEIGGPHFPNIFALGGTLDLINSIGIENIQNRIIELTNYLHEQLEKNGIRIVSATGAEFRSGITIIDLKNKEEVAALLGKKNILLSVRNRGLRVSLHFYNNFEDIDRFVRVLLATLRES